MSDRATKANATRGHSGSRGDALAFGRLSDRESAELSSDSESARKAGMAHAELMDMGAAEASKRDVASSAGEGEAAAADPPLALSLGVDLSESGSGGIQRGERGGDDGVTLCVGAGGPRALHQST